MPGVNHVGKIQTGMLPSLIGSTLFGRCEGSGGAANVVNKVASIRSGNVAGFETLQIGLTVHIFFEYSNTAANPTLDINGTGAIPIYRYGSTPVGVTPATSWIAGAIVSLTYNGLGWVMNDWLNTDAVIPPASSTTDGLMTSENWTKLNGLTAGTVTLTSGIADDEDWTQESTATYTGYGYKNEVSITGAASTQFPIVSFDPEDVKDYDLAPVAVTGTGTVTIYAKKLPERDITFSVALLKNG